MGRWLLALTLLLLVSSSVHGALISVTLETSPVSVSPSDFGVFRDPAIGIRRSPYAPLVNASVNQYRFGSTPDTFVNSTLNNSNGQRLAASRVDGSIISSGSTATIATTVYSYVETGLTSSSNQTLGRLRIELGGSNFTWETRLPSPEMARSITGALKKDPNGIEDAPAELLAYHTYYFVFLYQANGSARNVGGPGSDPFLSSGRRVDLILNATSGQIVPEPATGAVVFGLSLFAFGVRSRFRKAKVHL